MSLQFEELQEKQFTHALEEILAPRLLDTLSKRAPGHCMRIADLDRELMAALAKTLRNALPDVQIWILGEASSAEDKELIITSTKLVELRNPLADGTLRPPLLVFIPANLRTSAEDSFGVATFEDVTVTDVYAELTRALIARIPTTLQGYVREMLEMLRGAGWVWADEIARVRYLLTVILNGIDNETLGASLYELGLIPDFQLFDDPAKVQGRIHKNLDCTQSLTQSHRSVRGRTAALGLSERMFQSKLTDFLLHADVERPEAWTRQIVLDKANWFLSFDKWRFMQEIMPDKISIEVLHTDLPEIGEQETNEVLQGFIRQQVLTPATRRKLSVTFRVDPNPVRVQGLHHFSVQLIARDGGLTGVSKNVKIWTSSKNIVNVTLDKLHNVDFDEGWHFIRVLPRTERDDPIPLNVPVAPAGGFAKKANESEPFYVLPDQTASTETTLDGIQHAASLEHARLRLQFAAVAEGRMDSEIVPDVPFWADVSGKSRRNAGEHLSIKFGREGTLHIPVSALLKSIEQKILASPNGAVSWRLTIRNGQAEALEPEIPEWPQTVAAQSFLSTRKEYFNSVRGEGELVSQAVDFLKIAPLCLAYAEAYRDLLVDMQLKIERSSGIDQQKALAALRNILAVDVVHIVAADYRGRIREAALVGPTHPLRALWSAAWARVGQSWFAAATHAPQDYLLPVRDALLHGLSPLNMPITAPLPDGRFFMSIDTLHPFWSLYGSATETDARSLLSEVCRALGIPEPAIGGAAITGDVLASRIARFLVQHPYIHTLTINAFNPGSGQVIADAMVALQKQEAFADLRYDVRMFVSDPEAPGIGDAIAQLLLPGSTTSQEASDAFTKATGNHLFPKLAFAARSLSAFREKPQAHRAHLSLLFDLFPAQEIGASTPLKSEGTAPLHGLFQDFVADFQDDDEGTFWRRQGRHGVARPVALEDSLTDVMAELPRHISSATASVATGMAAFTMRPTVIMGLSVEQRELLHDIHEMSNWVFTIDRHINIEFFDHGGQRGRPEYLIDYAPGMGIDNGHRLLITSRHLTELEGILLPVIRQHHLVADNDCAARLLTYLRSLSGRLAVKLLSSPTQQAEALGLALARIFLQYQGALTDQIIIALDAHLELFRTAKAQVEDAGEATTLQRTDLALFDFNLETRTVTCNLVEVKCYSGVGGFAAYAQLKEKIANQIRHSEEVLQRHFDPHWKNDDRPDRLLKTRQLATLFDFYLARAGRYSLIASDAAAEASYFIDTLEDGYTLAFTRSALVFDFQAPGTEPPEYDQGIEYHRIGCDLIQTLIMPPKSAEKPLQEAVPPIAQLEIPHLERAAFFPPKRDRSASLERFQRKRTKSLDFEDEVTVKDPTPSGDQSLPVKNTEVENTALPISDVASRAGVVPPQSNAPSSLEALHQQPTNAQVVDSPTPMIPSGTDAAGSLPNPDYSIMLGALGSSPQYGILGEIAGRKVALDLNQPHTISLFGVQGGGKSYTLGSIIEMACLSILHVNVLPSPAATVVFHYSPTQDYQPEFTSMCAANSEADQAATLRERYGAEPKALTDVLLLAPASKVAQRRIEFPNIEVLPLAFASSELQAMHWKFLMGAIGNQSMYMRQINQIMRGLRDTLTLGKLKDAVDASNLSDHLKEIAQTRLQFTAEYIDDARRLTTEIRPGRLIIVDLRDEFIEKDEALGLFVVLLQIFSEATHNGKLFNKLVVFDEAHKYVENQDLVSGLIGVVREMRHKATSILVASQDPPSVPVALIELSSQIILHKMNSPAWLKHIQRANAALNSLTAEKVSSLGKGEAYVWSREASEALFTHSAVKIMCRPRVTQHGGGTKTAVSNTEL